MQDDRIQKLTSDGEVAQVFRTPGLSESAAAALKQQAHDAGLTSITDVSMEMVRYQCQIMVFKRLVAHKQCCSGDAACERKCQHESQLLECCCVELPSNKKLWHKL